MQPFGHKASVRHHDPYATHYDIHRVDGQGEQDITSATNKNKLNPNALIIMNPV